MKSNNDKFLYLEKKDFLQLVNFEFIKDVLWIFLCSIPIMATTLFGKIFPGKGKDLGNKIVVITGTGSGIGKSLAIEFAKNGCRLACVDINEAENDETVDQIQEMIASVKIKGYKCDVSDVDDVNALKNSILDDFGHVDILVNNAGIVYPNTVLTGKNEMIQKVIAVNQMSAYWMTRAFLPRMKERKEGHLVYTNSISSIIAIGDATAYSMSKFGLLGLTMSLLEEFNRDADCSNIRISSVHPYFVATSGLSNDPRSKRIKLMKPDHVAKQIITGIKREYFNFTVPGYETGYWLMSLIRLFPVKIYCMLGKLLYRTVLLPEDKIKDSQTDP